MPRQRSLMKKMNFRRAIYCLISLVPLFFLSCETLEPKDPRASIPGLQQYYNEALQFSLRYPRVLNLKVEDRAVAGEPDIVLRLEYPGNDYPILELATYAPSWIEEVRKPLVHGTERTLSVDTERAITFEIKNDPDDDESTMKRIIVRNFGRIYVFTGKGKTFDEVVSSFDFIDPVLEGAEQDSSS